MTGRMFIIWQCFARVVILRVVASIPIVCCVVALLYA